ncbi:MAG: murein L,D-transpeptidase [Chitinophagaceae bacterium]|nr:MAG: murein L,D-transpeptidase [Chitinophagaceae bacterium]
MKLLYSSLLFLGVAFITSCNNNEPSANDKVTTSKPPKPKITWKKASKNTYHSEPVKQWLGKGRTIKDTAGVDIILAVNRTDSANLASMDSILVPDDLSGDVATYMHFPESVQALADVDKIVFFSYPTQTFAAYENGNLVQAGPTNMGRKKDPTPTGLFFSNWKAVETTSTFNDEWNLRWNFNIQNKEGIGWHQYALPGYPASHSCLRLQTNDAKKLYDWADQWKLEGADKILANGTPAIVFGSYPFDGKKPWLALLDNPTALDISESAISELVKPNLAKILAEQEKTNRLRGTTAKQ